MKSISPVRSSVFLTATVVLALLVPPMSVSLAGEKSKSVSHISDGKSNMRETHQGVYESSRQHKDTPASAPGTVADGRGAVTYHQGGSVIVKPRVYVIWYGAWSKNSCSAEDGKSTTASILMDLVKNIGDSAWNGINATYYQMVNGRKVFVSSGIEYSGCVVDNGSLGLSLDGDAGPSVADVVDTQLSQGKLKTDANGVYLVLTSASVQVNGFPALLCGYHDYYSLPTVDIKYAFIGDPSNDLSGCASQTTISPNGNPAADAMASVLAHELVEPISDPLLNAWFDELGYENADKCAFRYGKVTQAADGSYSNMKIGDRRFLIQANVAANSNMCVLSVNNGDQRSSNSNG